MIAYAGFLFVVNPTNAGGKEQAKKILTNTIVGIVISLAAWMIVGAIMATLYSKDNKWGAWEDLILSGGGAKCLDQAGSVTGPSAPTAPGSGVTTGPGVSAGGLNKPPPGKAGTACDPAVIQNSAAASNWKLTDKQANIFACLAKPESSCGAPNKNLNYRWDKGTQFEKGSTAAGAFQVLLSSNHKCYENSACYKASGLAQVPLHCH
jgi:Type IV secretion system pilin